LTKEFQVRVVTVKSSEVANKTQDTSSVDKHPWSGRPRTVRTAENVIALLTPYSVRWCIMDTAVSI